MTLQAEVEQWVFDCPLHGMEFQVFCFRAFDDNNIDRWALIRGALSEVETTREMKLTQMRVVRGT